MPTLPTLTVTDAQAARLLAAFGSTDAYRAWLKKTLIDYVITYEERADYETWRQARVMKNEQMKTELNT